MKFLMMSLLALGLLWQNPPPVKEVPLGETFTLKVGEPATVEGTNLTIRFVGLPEDSRCPADVVCVWAGNARVKLKLNRSENKSTTVMLNTGLAPREATFKGYDVKLVGVSPQRKTGSEVNPGDYEVSLIVTKRSAS